MSRGRRESHGRQDVGCRAVLGTGLRLGSGLGPDRAPEGAAREADRALREGDARERQALRRRAALPAPQLRDPGRERLPQPDRPRGVRRPGREPRRVRDGLRDARPLRLRVDRDVLRDAHRRGRDDHAAPDRRAGRQVHPHPRQGVPDRDALLLRPRDRLALLVPVLLQRREGQRRLQGEQEGLVDDLGRLRRLLRRPDHQPRLHRLRRPLGLRDRRRRRRGPAVAVGRARAAGQPVRPDPGGRTSRSRPTRSSARSATAPTPTTRPSTRGSWSAPPRSGTGSRWARSTSPSATRPARSTSTSACASRTTRRSRTTSARR